MILRLRNLKLFSSMDASQRYELPPEIARILGTNYDADDIPIPEELRSQDTLPDSLDFGVDEDFDTISLEVTKRRVRELEKSGPGNADTVLPKAGLNTSSIEDYVRNFLAQASLVKTLETFQSEWLEVNAQGNLPATSQFVASIPDALVENRKLHKRISDLEQINANLKNSAEKARDQYELLRKDRDFHKSKHRRAYQEKMVLLNDLRRLRDHCALYEPLIRDLTERHDSIHRAKQMIALQRDKLESRVSALEETISAMRGDSIYDVDELIRVFTKVQSGLKFGKIIGADGKKIEVQSIIKTQPVPKTKGTYQDLSNPGHFTKLTGQSSSKMDASLIKTIKSKAFPSDAQLARLNPLIQNKLELSDFETVADSKLTLSTILTINAHDSTVSSVDFHQNRQVMATASIDGSWKVFSNHDAQTAPGQLILSGSGHTDFITSARFCPVINGQTLLTTTSADTICKLWNIATQQQVLELAEHSSIIWDCCWHCTGTSVVTCSQDSTIKLWDITTTLGMLADEKGSILNVGIEDTDDITGGANMTSMTGGFSMMSGAQQAPQKKTKPGLGYCIGSLRGHTGPVLSVSYEPFGNLVLSSSIDKKIKVWDPRTLTSVRSYSFNITNACKACWSLDSGKIAVGDVDGHIAVYDMRAMQPLVQLDLGQKAGVTALCFDRSSEGVIAACSDFALRIVGVTKGKVHGTVKTNGVLESIQFSRNSAVCVTGNDSGEVNVWGV